MPIPEPTLPVVDQLCPPSDQENIPPRAVTLPPLNVLVPIMEEELARVNECCRRSLVIRSQTCIKSDGRRLSHPYCRPAHMQLASISKIVATLTGGKGVITQWVHGGYFVKVPTQGPSGYFLSKTNEFFHNLLSNVPITNLSHLLRVLSKSTVRNMVFFKLFL